MSNVKTKLEWESNALTKYQSMTRRIPLFHREIAQKVVEKRAEINALERGAAQVEESDIVRAFFSEVPYTFYSLMIRLWDEVGFDYHPYEPK